MLTSGCMALAIAGMVACFCGDGKTTSLTCSDVYIQGLETCKEQSARLGVVSSSTSAIATTIITRPVDPHVGNPQP